MTLIEQIKEVMADHTGGAHISEIAEMVIQRYPGHFRDKEELGKKVSAVLASDARKKGRASFSRVKNKKTGSNRKGWYRLKRKPKMQPTPTVQPTTTALYTGKAGESAVMSELLFYGYNASSMEVDDGIDIVASKDNKFFHIQVKTSNITESGSFGFSIQKSRYVAKHSFQTFYIFVLRELSEQRYFNDYLVLPSSNIQQFIQGGVIKDGQSLSLRVQRDKRGRYMLNARHDVTIHINSFGQIE